jgi:hypothetical protein
MVEDVTRDNTRAYAMHDRSSVRVSPGTDEEGIAAQQRLLEHYTSPPADDATP